MRQPPLPPQGVRQEGLHACNSQTGGFLLARFEALFFLLVSTLLLQDADHEHENDKRDVAAERRADVEPPVDQPEAELGSDTPGDSGTPVLDLVDDHPQQHAEAARPPGQGEPVAAEELPSVSHDHLQHRGFWPIVQNYFATNKRTTQLAALSYQNGRSDRRGFRIFAAASKSAPVPELDRR